MWDPHGQPIMVPYWHAHGTHGWPIIMGMLSGKWFDIVLVTDKVKGDNKYTLVIAFFTWLCPFHYYSSFDYRYVTRIYLYINMCMYDGIYIICYIMYVCEKVTLLLWSFSPVSLMRVALPIAIDSSTLYEHYLQCSRGCVWSNIKVVVLERWFLFEIPTTGLRSCVRTKAHFSQVVVNR